MESPNNSGPSCLGCLPFIEVLTTHISAVDDLVSVGYGSQNLHTHSGLHYRSKSTGNSTKLKADIGDKLALRQAKGFGIEAERIVVGGQQIAGQGPIVVEIGFECYLVVQPLIVGTGGNTNAIGAVNTRTPTIMYRSAASKRSLM